VTDFAPEVRRLLSKAGWRFERRGKGDHERWLNPATGAHVTVVAKIRSRHTANGILKQAGIGKKF
jgi:predicted RNA binding protein YcfA (HicA-like mRNA interferase family)